ncbi:hypothetical protein [Legionella sainthelensi]|nr:hypothetical protein [Legionella sainthelensi]
MNKSINDPKPQVPPMEDPPLPDSYEPNPGETPDETPDPSKKKESNNKM